MLTFSSSILPNVPDSDLPSLSLTVSRRSGGNIFAYMWLGQTYQHQRRFSEAIEAIKKGQQLLPVDWTTGALAAAYAAAGNAAEARKLLSEFEEKSKRGYVGAYSFAAAHAALGEKARALDALEKAASQKEFFITYLKVDPDLDSLRSDPRFRELLGRLKFPA